MPADPRRLSFLLAVQRAGGVLAAAELMGVTASAVSQQISRLEAEEGLEVLERGPRGVTLTPAGMVLAATAERIEAELVEAQQAIAALGDGVAGTVKVGAFRTATHAVVAPALAPMAADYPNVDIEVFEQDPEVAMRHLRTGDLDVILLERDEEVIPQPPRGTFEQHLLDEPWRLIIPVDMAVPHNVNDLRDLTFVSGEPGTAADRAVQRLGRNLGTKIHTRHSMYDFDTTITLVSVGQGVALIPALALTGTGSDSVRVVRMDDLGSRELYVRYRRTSHEPTVAVRAMVDTMVSIADTIDLN
ncbi:MAG: LysR family transcriptional regulator [Cellulomonadaceae bacterium]|jgi:DNA-binding transcriptional LysR family regulator|nr:LysR family transcriptional regulator [Cellulomonadaceae bacterium]